MALLESESLLILALWESAISSNLEHASNEAEHHRRRSAWFWVKNSVESHHFGLCLPLV